MKPNAFYRENSLEGLVPELNTEGMEMIKKASQLFSNKNFWLHRKKRKPWLNIKKGIFFVSFSFFLYICNNIRCGEEMAKKFSRRRDLVNSYCEDTSNEGSVDLEESHFIENLPRPLIFCIPKKVGSISIYHYFINNLDENDQKVWLIGPSSDTRENIFKKRNPLKAMVTRHPFERLVSTFKHLFVTGLHDVRLFFCTKSPGCPETPNLYLAKEIIKILRPNAGENETNLTFKEFVTYLVDFKERFLSLKQEMHENYPNFEKHWVPYSRYKNKLGVTWAKLSPSWGLKLEFEIEV